MSLAQYTPHLITAGSLFLAIFLHARQTQMSVWRISWRSASGSALIAVVVIFFVNDNYLNLSGDVPILDHLSAIFVVGALSFVYGLILALLVGYVIKLAPSFFD